MLILDELRTRGIDVAAKQELINEVMRFAREGMAVPVSLSSGIDEALRISDSIAVMRDRDAARLASCCARQRSEAMALICEFRGECCSAARRFPAAARVAMTCSSGRDARADPGWPRELDPGLRHLQRRDGHLHGSFGDIVNRAAPLAIVALGLTLVIATRGIETSGRVAAISGAAWPRR